VPGLPPDLGSQPRVAQAKAVALAADSTFGGGYVATSTGPLDASTNARHVVIISEDGMRPELITQQQRMQACRPRL